MTNYYIKGASDKWVRPAGWLEMPDIGSNFNLFKWSEQVQQTVWTKTFVTVSQDLINSPDGNLTADVIYEDSSTNNHLLNRSQQVFLGETYYVSFWIKSQGRDNVRLTTSQKFSQDGTSPIAWFNLSTGVIVSQNSGFTGADLSLTSVGNGWYFVSYKQPALATESLIVFQLSLSPNGSTLTYAGDITRGISVWGSQISKTSVLKPYQKNEGIAGGDNKLAFLQAVYPNRNNTFTIIYSSNTINADVNWGDGTSTVIDNATLRTKTYDYNTITSPVFQDVYGNNYKQVVIELTYNSGNLTTWSINTSNPDASQILEAIISWSDNVSLTSSSSGAPLLQSLIIKKLTARSSTASQFRNMGILRNLEGFENITWNATSTSSMFLSIAVPSLGNLNITCQSAQTFFQSSSLKKLGNLNFIPNPTGAALTNFLTSSIVLEETGNIVAPLFNNMTGFFSGCSSLLKIGTIDVPNNTLLNSTFNNCFSLEEIVFVSTCANVTSATSAFNNCRNLRKLRLPNMAVSFIISNGNMRRPELVDLFNDLADLTSLPAQTITITGNPGVADLLPADLAILTGKNWGYTL